ncbi:MAG: hemerythrin domain-containing protein [Rubrivivax sp.]
MAGSPISLHPAPGAGFDAPFDMLSACHERVERMLQLLERLDAHLPVHGCDRAAVDAARDVMRYFDLAAPAHHEDEERHVLPVLRAQGDDAFAAQLQQEHVEMKRRWAELRRTLLEVAGGTWVAGSGTQAIDGLKPFAALYRAHAAAEDTLAFPATRAQLDPDAQRAMGQEMASRRGVPGPLRAPSGRG